MTVGDDRFTRDDLEAAAVQVEALRQDLAAYRVATERALKRRNTALIVAAAGLVLLLTIQTVGGWLLVRSGAQRAELLRETARMQACQQVTELRADLVTVLVEIGGPERFEEAIEILRPGDCAPQGSDEEAT